MHLDNLEITKSEVSKREDMGCEENNEEVGRGAGKDDNECIREKENERGQAGR